MKLKSLICNFLIVAASLAGATAMLLALVVTDHSHMWLERIMAFGMLAFFLVALIGALLEIAEGDRKNG